MLGRSLELSTISSRISDNHLHKGIAAYVIQSTNDISKLRLFKGRCLTKKELQIYSAPILSVFAKSVSGPQASSMWRLYTIAGSRTVLTLYKTSSVLSRVVFETEEKIISISINGNQNDVVSRLVHNLTSGLIPDASPCVFLMFFVFPHTLLVG